MSFYNLIPSCSICNSVLKRDEKFTLKDNHHPYIENIGDHFEITYNINSTLGGLGITQDIKVKIKPTKTRDKNNRKVNNAKRIFQWENIYSEHAEEIQDLISIKDTYGSNYLKILANNTYKKLKGKLSIPDLYRLAFAVYFDQEDFHKRPMSKLKKDILTELKII